MAVAEEQYEREGAERDAGRSRGCYLYGRCDAVR